MSNPWAQSFDELRSPYLQEKKAKRWQDDDCDGKWYEKSDVDGKISKREKKEKAKAYAEHHQKDADGKVIEHEDTTPSSVEEEISYLPEISDKKKKNYIKRATKDIKKLRKTKMTPWGMDTPSSDKVLKRKINIGKTMATMKKEQVEENKKFGPGGDPIKKQGFIDKALDKLKKNTPVKKIDKAHYEPEGKVVVEMDLKKIFKLKKGSKTQQDLDPTSSQKNDKLLQHNLGRKFDKAHYEPDLDYVQEALKGKKLEVKETGVKNKIEINPEIKTEAANAPVKK